jgi:hypothetical protein
MYGTFGSDWEFAERTPHAKRESARACDAHPGPLWVAISLRLNANGCSYYSTDSGANYALSMLFAGEKLSLIREGHSRASSKHLLDYSNLLNL